MTPTGEQLALIESRARIVVGNAYAGGGKSTTGMLYCERNPSEDIVYLTFNASNQQDLAGKIRERGLTRAKALTTHALARRQLIAQGRLKEDHILKQWNAYSVREMLQQLRQVGTASGYRPAALTQRVLEAFFQSSSRHTEPGEIHVEKMRDEWGMSDVEARSSLDMARAVWAEMRKPDRRIGISFDGFLKLWTMDKPQLGVDTIILDEFQDTRPCVLDMLMAQRTARLIALGDEHQSIYQFTGAVNAGQPLLADPRSERFDLTRTWRFGQGIADIANTILHELKGEHNRIIGMGPAGGDGGPMAYLSRTNATLYALAFNQDGADIHWNGGINRYPLQDAVDAWNLKIRNRSEIKNPFLKRFASWDDLVDYGEMAKDPDVTQLTKLIDEYGEAIPHKVSLVRSNAVIDPKRAELILSTAFISKGGEWNEVRLAEDFEYLIDAEEAFANGRCLSLAQIQEVNLGYVAVTRAKRRVHLNTETQTWLTNLERFQRNRRHDPSKDGRSSKSGPRMRVA